MWLYRHHTCSDIVDLDHQTGHWRPVDASEKPKGARVLADLPVRGSYTDVDGKRFYSYWTDDERFVFRAFDGYNIELCRKLPDGTVLESSPGLHCIIEPATYQDGRLRQGWSDVSLVDGEGQRLYQLTYDAGYYLRLYSSDFTAAAAIQDLSDWDFFVALQGGIEIFRERAASGRIQLTMTADSAVIEGKKMPLDELLFASSGEACPRAGIWVCTEDLRKGQSVQIGSPMPDLEGRSVQWVWSRAR